MNVIDLTFGRRRNSILARLVSASQKNFSTRSAMLIVWCRNNLQVCEKYTSNYLSISKSKRYQLDRSKRFTPPPPDRPVHSDTKSIYLHGKHSRHTAITCMRMLFTHISTTPYSVTRAITIFKLYGLQQCMQSNWMQ